MKRFEERLKEEENKLCEIEYKIATEENDIELEKLMRSKKEIWREIEFLCEALAKAESYIKDTMERAYFENGRY